MSRQTSTVIASVMLAGPALILWLDAPVLPVALGCGLGAAILLLRERRRGGERA
jgi:hypothetical protein